MEEKYQFLIKVEGGKSVNLSMSKERFEQLSTFCEKNLPEKIWKTKKAQLVDA